MADVLDIGDIKKHWKIATEGLGSWRTEAKESYDFASVHQWDPEDLSRLEGEERPAVTFDRCGVFIDAVCGMEINSRQAIKYLPVEPGDIHTSDALTNACKYYERDCGAADEDSEAVRDAITCGIGLTETVMDYEKRPEGSPLVIRRDPLQCWFDPRAIRRNLADREFQFYGNWMAEEEASNRWPDANFATGMPSDVTGRVQNADLSFLYREDQSVGYDKHDGQVFVLHYQVWKKEDYYRMRDPASGQLVLLNQAQFTAAKKLFTEQTGSAPKEEKDYLKIRKKVYYRAFVSGDEILEQGKLPVQQFTFKFLTFKRDRNRQMWYGMMRTMKDPARWANKWLSQVLHIVNTNAKGGAFAETNAFQDPKKAEADWAKANPLILMKEGAVSGGKVRERQQAQYPQGLDRLMQFAFNALPAVTGINLEILGLADRQQAGVLENQRRQSAYGILAPLFAAIREYRKTRGELMLEIIQKLIPAGTMVRILGTGQAQYVQVAHSDVTYDVVVDQAPDSPDYKRDVWDALGTIIPAMMRANYPIPPEVLNYSPLPTEVSEQWVQWIKGQGWMPPQEQQKQQQMNQMLQQTTQENASLKEQMMQQKLDGTLQVLDLQRKAKEAGDRGAVKTYQAQLDAVMRHFESVAQAQGQANDARVKAAEIAVNARTSALDRQMQLVTTLIKENSKQQAQQAPQQIKVENIIPAPKKPRKIKAKKQADGGWLLEENPEAA